MPDLDNVEGPLSGAEIAQIELELQAGNATQLKEYGLDTIHGNKHSQSTLMRRKEFLLKLRLDTDDHLHYFAILSAMTDDRLGWDSYSHAMKDDPDPVMPFLSYQFLMSTKPNADVMERWKFLVRRSAERGHLHAKHIVFLERFDGSPILRRVMSVAHKFYLAVLATFILIRDPTDRRLPRR